MNMFKALTRVSPSLAALAASPAFADGFTRANTVGQKIATGLHALAAITITIAVIWIGYKTLWNGDSLKSCGYIVIGAVLIGGGSEIAALLMG
ncbi:TrbC/VirB2 family protein [Salmonella enterica]|jgi:type IV secretion system protein VirB2|uniref:TrbC/VirB2 family protein n=2 Tax=Enterobacteriaceae TaxID=543 RepID=A7MRA8_CROS8|nr:MULTISPECIES: TrbC/VirB2 family protein [Enterobacteriaceae]EAC0613678.1 TriB protein [Salmonella enterica subsp. enterica]EAY8053619.1 TrbC/VirB2 family protein [Salmonella enterica]ECB4982958.1 TriB protein [Salmonella enterica subsp. enterica serovar Bovismorbificans]EFV8237275.1 TriB protein [Shigella sonnei]EIF4763044.1 TrbC/VirB2 family protein [Salmonella enterica subsp. enterica serovar Johannesburg]EIX9086543.1 TrbC/VirB2 family protein [Klebsiella aerogenes]ELW1606218.1 TrbC/Vir